MVPDSVPVRVSVPSAVTEVPSSRGFSAQGQFRSFLDAEGAGSGDGAVVYFACSSQVESSLDGQGASGFRAGDGSDFGVAVNGQAASFQSEGVQGV